MTVELNRRDDGNGDVGQRRKADGSYSMTSVFDESCLDLSMLRVLLLPNPAWFYS